MGIKVTVEKLTDERVFRRACEMTLSPGQTSKTPLSSMYTCEHSPIRTRLFWIEMYNIPTFVSVHVVRHKVGVEHYVQSRRDDRSGDSAETVTRLTPVNHGLLVNAQALIAMSRKRLCLHAHRDTLSLWVRVRRAVLEVDSALANHMVPECVYRNGYCPELRVCSTGPVKICEAYNALVE